MSGRLIFADFADGARARLERVAVELRPEGLVLSRPDGARIVWAPEDLRRLPDQADGALMILTSADMPLARLYLRDPLLRRAVGARAPRLRRRAAPVPLARLLRWGAAAVASVALIIFVLVPVMADQLARYLPPEGERALGDATFEQIRRALGQTGAPVDICERPAATQALEAMLARLAPQVDDLPYPVRVTILDNDLVNAFTLPGGRIILFRGLIEAAETPDEVAAVLAHEIGHAVHRDPTRDALRSAGSIGVLGLLFGDFAGGSVVLFLANTLINAQYSQQAETRADDYAHALLAAAALSPGALGTMFERLREKEGDASGIVAHFASHPALSERIIAAREAARGIAPGPPVLDDGQWQALSRACGGGLGGFLRRLGVNK